MALILVESRKSKVDMGSEIHDKHEGHHTQDFLKKFWVVFALTIPILVYSEIFEKVFHLQPPQFLEQQYVILALGSFVFFYGGSVFIRGAYREVRALLPGMMTLIAIAITAAYSFSVFAVLAGVEHTLFWELSTLIAVMLLGHWIEMKAVKSTQGALNELAKLLPDTVEVLRQWKTETIAVSELVVGDTVLVRPGGKIPADGIVIEGESEVDESVVTGE